MNIIYQVVNVLAESFEGIGNLARQLVLWLEFCGESTSGIESMVEDHVKDLLEEHFDPKKADTIFSEEGMDISSFEIYMILIIRSVPSKNSDVNLEI